ncbi:hypothetical protein HDU97_004693 [Phlyctochytrium planicorne]|nr:hypothetical protein HDU97_004693 [Phlyctochytrium planicorne]
MTFDDISPSRRISESLRSNVNAAVPINEKVADVSETQAQEGMALEKDNDFAELDAAAEVLLDFIKNGGRGDSITHLKPDDGTNEILNFIEPCSETNVGSRSESPQGTFTDVDAAALVIVNFIQSLNDAVTSSVLPQDIPSLNEMNVSKASLLDLIESPNDTLPGNAPSHANATAINAATLPAEDHKIDPETSSPSKANNRSRQTSTVNNSTSSSKPTKRATVVTVPAKKPSRSVVDKAILASAKAERRARKKEKAKADREYFKKTQESHKAQQVKFDEVVLPLSVAEPTTAYFDNASNFIESKQGGVASRYRSKSVDACGTSPARANFTPKRLRRNTGKAWNTLTEERPAAVFTATFDNKTYSVGIGAYFSTFVNDALDTTAVLPESQAPDGGAPVEMEHIDHDAADEAAISLDEFLDAEEVHPVVDMPDCYSVAPVNVCISDSLAEIRNIDRLECLKTSETVHQVNAATTVVASFIVRHYETSNENAPLSDFDESSSSTLLDTIQSLVVDIELLDCTTCFDQSSPVEPSDIDDHTASAKDSCTLDNIPDDSPLFIEEPILRHHLRSFSTLMQLKSIKVDCCSSKRTRRNTGDAWDSLPRSVQTELLSCDADKDCTSRTGKVWSFIESFGSTTEPVQDPLQKMVNPVTCDELLLSEETVKVPALLEINEHMDLASPSHERKLWTCEEAETLLRSEKHTNKDVLPPPFNFESAFSISVEDLMQPLIPTGSCSSTTIALVTLTTTELYSTVFNDASIVPSTFKFSKASLNQEECNSLASSRAPSNSSVELYKRSSPIHDHVQISLPFDPLSQYPFTRLPSVFHRRRFSNIQYRPHVLICFQEQKYLVSRLIDCGGIKYAISTVHIANEVTRITPPNVSNMRHKAQPNNPELQSHLPPSSAPPTTKATHKSDQALSFTLKLHNSSVSSKPIWPLPSILSYPEKTTLTPVNQHPKMAHNVVRRVVGNPSFFAGSLESH